MNNPKLNKLLEAGNELRDVQPLDTPIQVYHSNENEYHIGGQDDIWEAIVNEIDDDVASFEALAYQEAVEIETARRLAAAYNFVKDVPILVLETTTLEAFVRMMHGIYEKGTPHATG